MNSVLKLAFGSKLNNQSLQVKNQQFIPQQKMKLT